MLNAVCKGCGRSESKRAWSSVLRAWSGTVGEAHFEQGMTTPFVAYTCGRKQGYYVEFVYFESYRSILRSHRFPGVSRNIGSL